MNAKLKQKWIKALRSGEYVQGKKTMVRQTKDGHDEFCCLGVLADLMGAEFDGPASWCGPLRRFTIDGKQFAKDSWLPEVCFSGQSVLASMNDDGASFDEIADWIQERDL